MKLHLLFLTLVCVATIASAATKSLVVLGDKKIKAIYDKNLPRAVENNGVRTDVTGFSVRQGKLVRTLGFEFKGEGSLASVRVEDVTGLEAVLIVADSAPRVASGRWKGSGEAQEISKKTTPWVFKKGDTTMVYRFTIEFSGAAEPMVIYQPAVFSESAKAMLAMVANAKKE